MHRHSRSALFPAGALLCAAVWSPFAAAQPCVPEWAGVGGGVGGWMAPLVRTMTVFDQGAGSELLVAGAFVDAGGLLTGPIARWDGAQWLDMGGLAFGGGISTLDYLDAGGGPALFAGGSFRVAGAFHLQHVAEWTSAGWISRGDGLVGGAVDALAVYDHGAGPQLYAGGVFYLAAHGLSGPKHIARWDGAAWQPVGEGATASVLSLTVFDEGNGPLLFASGDGIILAPGTVARGVATWDGSAWMEASGAWDQLYTYQVSIADLGSGPAMYASAFAVVNGTARHAVVQRIAGDWHIIGTADGWVRALHAWDDGGGMALYTGGQFVSIDGIWSRVARWDGKSWASVGSLPLDGVRFIFSIVGSSDDPNGRRLYVGGNFRHLDPANGCCMAAYSYCEPTCYSNCDGSSVEPILTVDDFTCFINEFAIALGLPYEQQIEQYANCDGSTTVPVLTVDDFTCFINAFAAGCP